MRSFPRHPARACPKPKEPVERSRKSGENFLTVSEGKIVLSKLLGQLGELGAGVIGIAVMAIIFLGPYVIARAIPDQAYHGTLVAAFLAIPVAVVAAMLAILRPMRRFAAVAIFISAAAVWVFTWVWPLLIVDGTFGLTVLYIANLFLGVGAIVLAFFALLLGAHWSTLGQFVGCIVIATAMQWGGAALWVSAGEATQLS
jgi:hypothetical protein